MRADSDTALLAMYHHHQWNIEGSEYYRVDCTDRVDIHFERSRERSSKYGPFDRFSAVNGLAYGDNKVVAFLDAKISEWLYYDSGYHWPTLIVTDATSRH